MGKRHSRRQDVCILTESNSVDDAKLDSGVVHAEDPDSAVAWLLDSQQQFKDEYNGRWHQVISDLSFKPIVIFDSIADKRGTVDKNITTISKQTEDEEMVFLDRRKSKDGRLLWLGICLAMLTLTVCIVVLLNMQGG